jgi:D-beta-D-heptose 7-phosphate kinase/D-beta-D-heptose 1-phosphate adenosyltransferase
MILVEADGGVHSLPAAAHEVYDVSGAGDTAVAALAAALAAGVRLVDAALLANLAAGIVVGKIGTAVAHPGELSDALMQRDKGLSAKVQPLARALERIEHWRHHGLRIGFTNGCFDLLHAGHVTLLEQAREACDRLVVGLNSDDSVARLKGPTRPVQPVCSRSAVLAALSSVDLVVVFHEDTPLSLIEAMRPDVLVKGADYRLDQIVGADLVTSYGGKVILAELLPGESTTAIVRKLDVD